MVEQMFVVFSLSEKDEAFDHKDMGKAVRWLKDKKMKPICYFRETSPIKLSSGGIMLFSFDAKIFGQATLKGSKKETPPNDKKSKNYKYFVYLEPTSIEIFPKFPTKKEVTNKLNKNFGRMFTYFTCDEYQKIKKMARLR